MKHSKVTIYPPVRIQDTWGSGTWLASRGSRLHKGIDLAAYPGSRVASHVTGRVSKIGYPYPPQDEDKGHYRYVEVKDDRGLRHRFFYVMPTVQYGDPVMPGKILGISQTLQPIYPGITDHIHYEIKNAAGERIDPRGFV